MRSTVQEDEFDIFLSYNSHDAAAARVIEQALSHRGLKVFFADRYMPAGTEVNKALASSLGRCTTVAVLLGPAGLGPFQSMEKDLAILRRTKEDSRFRVWLTVLPGGDPKQHLDELDPIRRYSCYPFLTTDPDSPWFKYAVDQHMWAVRSARLPPNTPLLQAPTEPAVPRPGAEALGERAPPGRQAATGAPAPDAHDEGALASFAEAARKRGAVLLLGRRWREMVPGGPADETHHIGRRMIQAMSPALASRMHGNVLPPVDDIAGCLHAVLGPDRLEEYLSDLLTEAQPGPGDDAEPVLSRYLRTMLALSGGGLRGGPPEQRVILVSSGHGLLLEKMLIRYRHPFMRIVPLRGSQARVDACTDASALQDAAARLALQPDGAAAFVWSWLRAHTATAALDVQSGLVLGVSVDPHVILVKCMGSIDEDDSCVLTRAHLVQFADTHGRGGVGNFMVQALSVRPVLIAGFRQFDSDFALLASLFLRRVLQQADARNPRLMARAQEALLDRGNGAAPGFFSDELLASGAAVVHDGLTQLGIRPVPLALPDMLQRLGARP